jgi:DNA polymerase III sliding clamp (beta) subunit (PCNA family)
MNRRDLLAALHQIEPAIAAKGLINSFRNVFFDGTRVSAYDDKVALSTELAFEFKGGVEGKLLIPFLERSRAKEVEVEQEQAKGATVLAVKAGRARLKLPTLPVEDFAFKFPKLDNATLVDPTLVGSLALAAISLGTDPGHEWRLGITVDVSDGKIVLCSSDNLSCSRVSTKVKAPEGLKPVVLPPNFIQLLLSIERKDIVKNFYLARKWAAVEFASGLRLYARTIADVQSKRYVSLFKRQPEQWFAVPKNLGPSIERALVIIDTSDEKVATFDIAGGKLRMTAKTASGEVKEALSVPDAHPTIKVQVQPSIVLRALDKASMFSVLEDRVCLSDPDEGFEYLVALVGGS